MECGAIKIALLSFNIVFFYPVDITFEKCDSPRKGFHVSRVIFALPWDARVCFLGINFNAARYAPVKRGNTAMHLG